MTASNSSLTAKLVKHTLLNYTLVCCFFYIKALMWSDFNFVSLGQNSNYNKDIEQ